MSLKLIKLKVCCSPQINRLEVVADAICFWRFRCGNLVIIFARACGAVGSQVLLLMSCIDVVYAYIFAIFTSFISLYQRISKLVTLVIRLITHKLQQTTTWPRLSSYTVDGHMRFSLSSALQTQYSKCFNSNCTVANFVRFWKGGHLLSSVSWISKVVNLFVRTIPEW